GRQDLDVIGGRAGALRDARYRGRLYREAEPLGGGDDPLGQHAAALAAQRSDQDRDRTAGRGHVTASARPPSQSIKARRVLCTKRSKALGLRTSSARWTE